jgi:hypothetical protein
MSNCDTQQHLLGWKKNKKRYKVDDKMSIKLEEEEFLSTGIEIHDFRLVFFHRRR